MDSTHVFEGHSNRVFSLGVCSLPNGSRIAASAGNDRTVHIWCLNTLQLLRFIEYPDFVWRVFIVLTPKPLIVAFISAEDSIYISDPYTGETVNIISGRLIFAGNISLFNNKAVVLISGPSDDDISFIDVITSEVLQVLRGGFEKVFRAVVSPLPNSNLVFTTWNAQKRRSTIQTYQLTHDDEEGNEHNNSTNNPIHSSNSSSNMMARASPSLFNSSNNTSTQDLSTLSSRSGGGISTLFEGDSRDGVTSLVITVFNKPIICSGHYDAKIRLWSIETKEQLRVLEGHKDSVYSVAAWKGNHPVLVSGSCDRTVKVWDTQTGELLATGEGHNSDIWALAVTVPSSHSGGGGGGSASCPYNASTQLPLIVSGSFDRTVRVWDVNPLLKNRNWHRRRDYCMFLSQLGLCASSQLKERNEELRDQSDLIVYRSHNNSSGSGSSSKGKKDSQRTIATHEEISAKEGTSSLSPWPMAEGKVEGEEELLLERQYSAELSRVTSKVFHLHALCICIASYI